MRRHIFQCIFVSVLLAALAAGLAGCRDPLPDTVNLSVHLGMLTSDRSVFTSTPDPEITSYRITGSGPMDSSFEITTESRHAVVEGIFTGTWEILAEGTNEEGTVLVEGGTTVKLTLEESEVVLDLYPSEGNGQIEIDLEWCSDDMDIYMVQIVFRRTDCPEENETVNYATTMGDRGVFTRSLPAGDYIIQFRAIDSEFGQVSNITRSMNIYRDSVTKGSIFLDTEIPSITQGMQIIDHSSPSITGALIGAPLVIYEGVPLELTFVPDNPELADIQDITMEWYLNGERVRTVQGTLEEMIIPEQGNHKLDVLVYSSRQGSLASASLEFTAHDSTLTEDLQLIDTLTHQPDGLALSMVSDVTVTPDGTVIASVRGSGVLQVFSPSHDGTLEHMYTIEDSAETPLRGARAAAVSSDGSFLCVVSDVTPSVSIYTYNDADGTYIHASTLSEDLDPQVGIPLITPSAAVIADNLEDIYVSDQGSDSIYHLVWDGTQLQYSGSAEVTEGPDLSSPRSLSIDPSGSYLASANMENSSLHIFSIGDQGELSQSQVFSYSHDGTMGISQINSTAFSQDGALFTTSNSFLCRFGYDDGFENTYRVKEGDFPDCHMAGLRTVLVDDDRDKIYVGSVTSRGITVFDRNPDGTLTFRSFTPCGPIHRMAMDPEGSFLYAVSTTGHSLLVFDVR